MIDGNITTKQGAHGMDLARCMLASIDIKAPEAAHGLAPAPRAGAMFGDDLKSHMDSLENQGVQNAGGPLPTAVGTMPPSGGKGKARDRRNELPRLCIALSPSAMMRLQGRAKRMQVTPQALVRSLLATGAQPDVPPVFVIPALERTAVATEEMDKRLAVLAAELLRRIDTRRDLVGLRVAIDRLRGEVERLRTTLDGDR